MRIPQGLRRHPVLAITAVQIASQHAKAVSQRSRISMEKRFLLNRIALHSTYISPGHVELSALVVADFAYARLAFENRTAVSAGKAAYAIAIDFLVQIAFTDVLIEDFAQGWQGGHLYFHFSPTARIPTLLRGRLPDVMRMQPVLSLNMFRIDLRRTQVRGALGDVKTSVSVSSSLGQQAPVVSFAVIPGHAFSRPKAGCNFGLSADVALFRRQPKPVHCLVIVLLHMLATGIAHAQLVLRSGIPRGSKLFQILEVRSDVTLARGTGLSRRCRCHARRRGSQIFHPACHPGSAQPDHGGKAHDCRKQQQYFSAQRQRRREKRGLSNDSSARDPEFGTE